VSSETEEWVYLMVQDKRTGRMVTLADNRAMLRAKNANERDAFSALLGSGNKNDQN